MHVGEIVAEGIPHQVLQEPAVVASYLASADVAVGADPVGAGDRR